MSNQTYDPSTGQQPWTPPAAKPARPFYRPQNGRMLGGVCAAIADYFGWDRNVVRLLAVLSILLPGPQVVAYIALWLLVPSEERYWSRHATPTTPPAPPYPTQP